MIAEVNVVGVVVLSYAKAILYKRDERIEARVGKGHFIIIRPCTRGRKKRTLPTDFYSPLTPLLIVVVAIFLALLFTLILISLLGFDEVCDLVARLVAVGAPRAKPTSPVGAAFAVAKLAFAILAVEQLFAVVLSTTRARQFA
jgi:hypothetical protein